LESLLKIGNYYLYNEKYQCCRNQHQATEINLRTDIVPSYETCNMNYESTKYTWSKNKI